MSFLRPFFTTEGWRAIWIALRRSPRDARARKNLFRLVVGVLIAFVYLLLYFYQLRFLVTAGGPERYMFLGVAVFMAGILFYARARYRWDRRKQDRDDPPVSTELKNGIYREACLLAALLDRLASEVGMDKELPPGISVITRRVILDKLAVLNLREGLDPWLLDCLLAPDGHWAPQLKNRSTQAWECLHVLRWALGLGDLRPLTVEPKYKVDDARALFEVKRPEKLNVLPSWDIRPERRAADVFFSRCWTELSARRELENLPEEDIRKALQAREVLQEQGYTRDFIIGSSTISELPSHLLWVAALRAYNRWCTLSLLVDISTEEKPVSELRNLFSRFFSSTDEDEEAQAETTR